LVANVIKLSYKNNLKNKIKIFVVLNFKNGSSANFTISEKVINLIYIYEYLRINQGDSYLI
jgi:hypothetical protein